MWFHWEKVYVKVVCEISVITLYGIFSLHMECVRSLSLVPFQQGHKTDT